MNIIDYQKQAQRTCPSLGSTELDILHMDLGISTEVGELLDIFKKHIAYKKELDKVHIGEEIADIAWYTVNKARIDKAKLEIISYNIDDIKKLAKNENSLEAICDVLIYSVFYLSTYNKLLGVIKAIAEYFELDFYKLLDNNIDKLKVRYPEKFTEEKALNRNLKKERAELEK